MTLPILGNTTFWLLILMAASVVFAAEAGSQERDPTPSEPTNIGHSAEDVVSVLAKRLSLTEDQRSNLLPIIVERRRKIQEVWTSSTLFVRQKQDKCARSMKTVIRESTHCLRGTSRKLTSPWSRKGKFSGDFDVLRASVLRRAGLPLTLRFHFFAAVQPVRP